MPENPADPKLLFVFDCESVGLLGETYAVGGVVVNLDWDGYLDEFLYYCPSETADDSGHSEQRTWVAQNVEWHLTEPTHRRPREVRTAFYKKWMHWKQQRASVVVDCGHPVETRFLLQVARDDLRPRYWESPYPLHDLATMRLAAGLNPLEQATRLDNELPAHNPLCNSRQTARLWKEAATLFKAANAMRAAKG